MRITIFALNVLIVFIYLQIANHRQMLTHYVVGSPEYKQIIDLLKAVDRLHCITAHLPMQNTNEENPKVPEDIGRPSTSSTPASHSVLHPIRLSLGRIPLYPTCISCPRFPSTRVPSTPTCISFPKDPSTYCLGIS